MDIDTTSPFIRNGSTTDSIGFVRGTKEMRNCQNGHRGLTRFKIAAGSQFGGELSNRKKVTVIHLARSSVEMRVRDESGRECNNEGADSKSVWSVTVQNPVDELDTDSWPRWASPGSNCMA